MFDCPLKECHDQATPHIHLDDLFTKRQDLSTELMDARPVDVAEWYDWYSSIHATIDDKPRWIVIDNCGDLWNAQGDNLDPEGIHYEDPEEFGPIGHKGYPVITKSQILDASKLKGLNIAIAESLEDDGDGRWHLMPTGDDMDYSWDVAAAYIRLGFVPSLNCVGRLPRPSGQITKTERLQVVHVMLWAAQKRIAETRDLILDLDKTLGVILNG